MKSTFSLFHWSIVLIFISCKREGANQTDNYFYYNSETEFINNNEGLSDTAKIGKLIFFDKNMSEPVGISCATCHSPMHGFSDPDHEQFSSGVYGHKGNRNANAISYMVFAPNRSPQLVRGITEMTGGFFWDGKAEFLNQQALFPLINPDEMNNPNFASIANKIQNASYYSKLKDLFGSSNLVDSQTIVFAAITALQSFEQSFQVNPFTSKYDFYLRGKTQLSAQELRGLNLFNDTTKAKCSLCHRSEITTYASNHNILFTDFSYENLGLPKAPSQVGLPIDSGLGKFEWDDPLEVGRFKTPTLRNIEKTAPYMHNGIFTTLEDVLDFYNTRDVNASFVPEYTATMNHEDLGDLKLTDQEKQDIIAFLKTLSDGFKP